jgi:trimeric autotransporter adhesin
MPRTDAQAQEPAGDAEMEADANMDVDGGTEMGMDVYFDFDLAPPAETPVTTTLPALSDRCDGDHVVIESHNETGPCPQLLPELASLLEPEESVVSTIASASPQEETTAPTAHSNTSDIDDSEHDEGGSRSSPSSLRAESITTAVSHHEGRGNNNKASEEPSAPAPAPATAPASPVAPESTVLLPLAALTPSPFPNVDPLHDRAHSPSSEEEESDPVLAPADTRGGLDELVGPEMAGPPHPTALLPAESKPLNILAAPRGSDYVSGTCGESDISQAPVGLATAHAPPSSPSSSSKQRREEEQVEGADSSQTVQAETSPAEAVQPAEEARSEPPSIQDKRPSVPERSPTAVGQGSATGPGKVSHDDDPRPRPEAGVDTETQSGYTHDADTRSSRPHTLSQSTETDGDRAPDSSQPPGGSGSEDGSQGAVGVDARGVARTAGAEMESEAATADGVEEEMESEPATTDGAAEVMESEAAVGDGVEEEMESEPATTDGAAEDMGSEAAVVDGVEEEMESEPATTDGAAEVMESEAAVGDVTAEERMESEAAVGDGVEEEMESESATTDGAAVDMESEAAVGDVAAEEMESEPATTDGVAGTNQEGDGDEDEGALAAPTADLAAVGEAPVLSGNRPSSHQDMHTDVDMAAQAEDPALSPPAAGPPGQVGGSPRKVGILGALMSIFAGGAGTASQPPATPPPPASSQSVVEVCFLFLSCVPIGDGNASGLKRFLHRAPLRTLRPVGPCLLRNIMLMRARVKPRTGCRTRHIHLRL